MPTPRFLALTTTLLLACAPGGGGEVPEPDAGIPEVPDAGATPDAGSGPRGPTWTLFVYGHADHNLSNTFMRDLAEMAGARLAPEITLLVAVDLDSSQRDVTTGRPFKSGTQWLRVHGQSGEMETLFETAEQDFDSPGTLESAVFRAFRDHPADRYGLILWDHGGSWRGGFGGDSANGTAYGKPMTAEQVATAIRAGFDAAGIQSERPLAFVAFDTCLMSGLEVAMPFETLASTYLAAAELDFGDGWDYRASLEWLSEHLDATPTEFAAAEVRAWDAHHAASGNASDTLLRSHAALDLTRLDETLSALKALSVALKGSPQDLAIAAREQSFAQPAYLDDTSGRGILRDAGSWAAAMASYGSPTIAPLAEAFHQELRQLVLALASGDLRTEQSGVHLTLPTPTDWTSTRATEYRFKNPAFVRVTGWADVLDSMVAANDGVPPDLTVDVYRPDNAGGRQPELHNYCTSDDAVTLTSTVWADDPNHPGESTNHGLVTLDLVEPPNLYYLEWNMRTTQLVGGSGGPQPLPTRRWLDLVADGRLPPVTIAPGMLRSASFSGEVPVSLFVELGATEARYAALDQAGSLAVLDLTKAALDFEQLTFTPDRERRTAAGLIVRTSGSPVPVDTATGLTLVSTLVPPGSYTFETQLSDYWGNRAVSRDAVSVLGSEP